MRDDHENLPGPTGTATADEQLLRGLLAGAVQGLEPSEDALERLRHAVPVRRARKRQALLATAAVALLAGTAIPAALHLNADEGAVAGQHSAMAGHGQSQGPKAADASDPRQNGSDAPAAPRPVGSPGGGHSTGGGTQPSPQTSGSPSGGTSAGPVGAGAGAPTGGAGHGPLPPVGAAPGAAPGCTAEQLGVSGSARAPETDGKVYGSFKVTNVSARGCTVSGPDTVTAASVASAGPPPAPAAAPPVTVTGHTAGDPASALLPDPSAEAPVVLLQPNTAYEVRFAWVPSGQSCPAAKPAPSLGSQQEGGAARPTAGREGGAAGGTAGGTEPAGADAGPAKDPQTGSRNPAATGVEVSHTPGTGAPVTQTTIPAACGGTVYRTGLIPPGAP
ncbi:hypothetical protein QEZ40_004042 [Streptomyces katrae]|uniref:DUF4232 domain-containing protein n=1 Tax=Streptomyces katrae TaxID=68223 RepID=A0ABT7GYW8_9ACTN|nr:hypothetical protein [Streptomyces katrae]MDK9498836.1 hypothetical protein [Streptomyces katrae]